MRVLGIETSCDETGIAIYEETRGIIAHEVYSQTDVHLPYGGVVPELASRDHIKKTIPMIRGVITQAGLSTQDISGVAYTAGPGLVGALMVGAAIGRSFAWGLRIPAIAVHHMEAHLLAPLLDDSNIPLPFIALLVSGGHTQLIEVQSIGQYKLLGESIDDAAGEAFDKLAKLMGLGYPGGPKISKLAEQGAPTRFNFPRPMIDRPGLDFSFSGLKTAAINTFRKYEQTLQTNADIACAFESAVTDTLAIKCKRAMVQTGISRLVIAGGVSANKKLREKLLQTAAEINGTVYFPRLEYCTDNGAMVAFTGYLRLKANFQESNKFDVKARWNLSELPTCKIE